MRRNLLLKTMLLLCAIVFGTSAWGAETVTFNYLDYKGEGTTSTGSSYTMVKEAVSINGTKFYGNNSYAHFYASGIITITPADNIKITKIELTASSTSYNGYQSSGTVTPSTGSMSHDGTLVTWTGSATKEFTIENSKQIRWTSIVVTYEAVSSFSITAQSNNTEWGTVSGTTTITASPKTGYRVSTTNPYTVTPDGSATVEQTGNIFAVTPSANTTITINFEAIPTHTVTWSVSGVETSEEVAEGAAITFPANPADLGGKTFMGWTETAIAGTTDVAPTYVTSATMGTSDLKYYAVFATGTSGVVTITDNLTNALIGISGTSYSDWTGKQDQSDAVYAGSSAGGNDAVQLRASNNSGIISTTSGGKVKKITVTWNSNTAADRTLDIYGNNTAYTATSNLYSSATRGTKLGSIVYGTSTELTVSGDYEFIGMRSNSGAMYLDNIAIEWESGGTTYSAYCTTVTATVTIPAGKEWITFCSTANLDFSEAIEGLKGAYTITAHESQAITLTATEMTGTVKAGTGLLLRAKTVSATDAQVINIPVAATGEEQADNMLKGVTEDTEIAPTTGEYTNLGLKDGEFHPYTNGPSDMAKLKAGKAYLQVPTAQMPTGGNNARLYIVLDGEATGINAIENSELRIENLDAPMYNLAGQRVTKSYKGVVIVNGKKYINK